MDKTEQKINQILTKVNIISDDVLYIKGMILELINQIGNLFNNQPSNGPPSPLSMKGVDPQKLFKGKSAKEVLELGKQAIDLIKDLKELNKE